MKRKHIAGPFWLGLLTLAAETAWAAEAAESGPLDFLWKLVNVVVLGYILLRFAKKPVGEALNSSAAEAKRTLEEAREAEQRLETELKSMREEVGKLEQQAADMVERARHEAEAERQRILEEGRQEVHRMADHARLVLEREHRKAQYELKQWIAEESLKLAEEQIKSQLDGAKQQELMNSFVKDLKSEKAA
jgi:F-type H+-transporting ATPase subunit b